MDAIMLIGGLAAALFCIFKAIPRFTTGHHASGVGWLLLAPVGYIIGSIAAGLLLVLLFIPLALWAIRQ